MNLFKKLFGKKKVKEEPVVEPIPEETIDAETRERLMTISLNDEIKKTIDLYTSNRWEGKWAVRDRLIELSKEITEKYKDDLLQLYDIYIRVKGMFNERPSVSSYTIEDMDFIEDWYNDITQKTYTLKDCIILPEGVGYTDTCITAYGYGCIGFKLRSTEVDPSYWYTDPASLKEIHINKKTYIRKDFRVLFNGEGYQSDGDYCNVKSEDVVKLIVLANVIGETIIRTKWEFEKLFKQLGDRSVMLLGQVKQNLSRKPEDVENA